MAHGNLIRRALTDLPVNTSASPRQTSSLKEMPTSLKRHVHEIDDPEYPVASIRLRVHSVKIPQGHLPEIGVGALQKKTPSNLANQQQQISDGVGEMDEGSSQDGSKESMCSLPEFDIGDETMASQETTATEVTSAAEPTATQHAETLRLRLRVALFKVQTNQTNIPMSQLQISTHELDKLLEPVSVASSPLEEASLPKLLPAPVLRPTAYSARTIPRRKIPTSPPDSTVNSPEPAAEVIPSPKLATPPPHKHLSDPIQTSSPPNSPEHLPAKVANWENSTRSAIRGKKAAIGLLDLRCIKE
ncbi:hypothetical protein MMC22_005383 [Lobaria immixta]|nr:hypothetical protein [Lobaria immixta]